MSGRFLVRLDSEVTAAVVLWRAEVTIVGQAVHRWSRLRVNRDLSPAAAKLAYKKPEINRLSQNGSV